METITCKECGHSNESQRVYCHNCGVRLDRSALIEEARKPKKVVKANNGPKIGRLLGGFLWGAFKVVFFAVLAAGLIEAARPPDGVPKDAELGGAIVDAPSLTVDLEGAAVSPTRLVYTEPALNAYLRDRVKA